PRVPPEWRPRHTGRREAQAAATAAMTQIQPQLWVDRASEAVAFYEAAFGATVLHRVGAGEDIVAQLAVGEAAFWVTASSSAAKRFSPEAIGGATGRRCWSLATQKQWFGKRWRRAPSSCRRSAKSTAGGLAASPIRSATNGRSAHHSASGHRPESSPRGASRRTVGAALPCATRSSPGLD